MRFGFYLVAMAFTLSAQESAAPEPATWHIDSQQFIAPPGASKPSPVKIIRSSTLPATLNHSVSVIFEISDKGVPFNVRVEHSSDAESADEVIALLREWRFEAFVRDGVPLVSKGYLDLSLNEAPTPVPPVANRPKLKATLKP
jgi:hypothetical protein